MSAFDKLDPAARRAAFAHMSAAGKVARAKKPGHHHTAARRMAAVHDLKAAQDARIRAATRTRVQADIAETRRQQAIWARRPSK
jgi:hypothetical protein